MVTLENMIRADLINLNIKARTKKQAVEEIADLLFFKDIVGDRAVFAKSVLINESETTDNKGNGIALTHGKSSAVSVASIAIGRMEKSISWEDFGEPVDVIIVVAIPAEDIHVERLGIIELLDEMLGKITVVSDLYNLQSPKDIEMALINYIEEL